MITHLASGNILDGLTAHAKVTFSNGLTRSDVRPQSADKSAGGVFEARLGEIGAECGPRRRRPLALD